MRIAKRFAIAALLVAALFPSATRLAQSQETVDVASPIPQKVIELLADGKLKKAVFAMRELDDCPKANYLLHAANRIVLSGMEKKPSSSAAHEAYQNIAIAYHNLYLFLKANGIEQREYFDGALEFYSRARRAGTHLHKAECDVLESALIAAGGDPEKAVKKFSKVDDLMLRGDFESMEYLAAYYAAVKNAAKALEALDAAFAISPKKTLAWLSVSDDFEGIKDDPQFTASLSSWRAKREAGELTLNLPRCEKPRLEMAGADPFAPTGFSRKAKKQLEARERR